MNNLSLIRIRYTALLGVLAFAATAYSTARAAPRLSADNTRLLSSEPVLVIYTIPAEPLGFYMSWKPPMPPLPEAVSVTPANSDSGTDTWGGDHQVSPMGGAVGMAAQQLFIDLANNNDGWQNARARLNHYMPLIDKLQLPDEEYAAAKDVISAVPWLGKASSQHIPFDDATHSIQEYMRDPGARAAIVIVPKARLRDDMNQVVVTYDLTIYAKDAYDPRGSSEHLAYAFFGGVRTSDRATGFPIINYYEKNQAPILDESARQYFSDGGARFHRNFDTVLGVAKAQLMYYFFGNHIPVVADTEDVVKGR